MSRYSTLAQKLAFVFGVTFIIAGIAGFIPGITVNYDQMKFAGNESDAELLGLFQVSILHNIVHLLFGVGVLAAKRHRSALQYLLYSGILYVVLFVYGLLFDQNSDANFVPINNGDDWLHIFLALGLLGAWFVSKGAEDPEAHRGNRIELDRDDRPAGTL